MTDQKVRDMLDEIGIEYRYYQFEVEEAISPPFMVYYYPGSDNFSADGKVYYKINHLKIEVYTDQKDIDMETVIDTVLDNHELYYDKTEAWLENEKMFEILYELEV